MRYSVCVEGVLNETRTVTNQGENPEVLNQKEEDIEDNKKIIAKLKYQILKLKTQNSKLKYQISNIVQLGPSLQS